MSRSSLSLLLFAGLAIAHTWPLAASPASLSRHDSADALLNEWILAWVAHAAATDPWQLFDANIFHPEPRTLAFSEHLLAPSMIATPLIWLGAAPLVAHNLTLLAGLTLTGWTMSHVVERWTGNPWAGLAAGSLAAFNASTLTRLAHVQAVHVEFLPLALAALDRLLVRSDARASLSLAGWTILQALVSGYLLVMTALTLLLAAIVRASEWMTRDPRRLLLLAAAGGLACVALAPVGWQYHLVRREQGLVRPLGEVALYSATAGSYLSTGATVHLATWGRQFFAADSLFPGVAALLLAGIAAVHGHAWSDRRGRMLLVAGMAGVVLSFGPAVPGYRWIHEHLPLLQGLRGAARFGFLGLFAVAGLAGLGLAQLIRHLPAGRARALGAGALILVNVEACRAPVIWTPARPVSAVYDALAREPPGALVVLPLPEPDRVAANAPAVADSARHFRKMVNGYSGFVPASYGRHTQGLTHFPDDPSRSLLASLGVSHIVVDVARAPPIAAAAAGTPWLTLVAESSGLRLYRIRR